MVAISTWITTEAGDMMGENDNQAVVWHTVQIEDLECAPSGRQLEG